MKRCRIPAFVLTTVAAIVPLLILLYWLRSHPRDEMGAPSLFYFMQALNIAAAVGTWRVYRSEPKTA